MIGLRELAPDLILTGGPIHTVSDRGRVKALAVKAGRIVWVGPAARAADLAGPGTRVADLRGRSVVPGFVDSHNHTLKTGLDLAKVQLAGARTLDQVLAAVAARAAETEDGGWIVGSAAWHEANLAERRLPTRDELDAAAPRHPIYLPRGGHTAVVNSRALALAGIEETTPDPPGGTLIRDPESKRLTGQLFETPAMSLVARHLPAPTFAEKVEALRRAQALFHAVGITAVRDPGLVRAPGLDAEDFRAYQALWREGALALRVVGMVGVPAGNGDAGALLGDLERRAVGPGFGDARLRVGGIKLITDGGVETAYLSGPYASDPAFEGVRVMEAADLLAVCRAARRAGWPVGVHCVGDAAVEMVTAAFEQVAREEGPLADAGWALEHAILASAAQSRRVRDLGVYVTAQTVHLWKLGLNMVKHWGSERAQAAYPCRRWLDLGIRVAGGTDANVCPHDQLLALYVDVTRTTEQGDRLGPAEALSPAEALAAHTRTSAECLGLGRETGSLEPGKRADLVVLSDDPLAGSPERLRACRVLATLVDGEVVFRHDESPV